MFSPQVRSQGVTEELKCLSLLNALDKDQDIPDQLAQLFGEPCIKLAEGIKAYISKVRPKHSGVSFADFRWVLGRLCRPPPGVIWSRWWLEVSAWRNLPGNTERGGGTSVGRAMQNVNLWVRLIGHICHCNGEKPAAEEQHWSDYTNGHVSSIKQSEEIDWEGLIVFPPTATTPLAESWTVHLKQTAHIIKLKSVMRAFWT